MRDMRGLFGAAVLLALAPLALPTYGMTLLTEALILGLLAMSLDLMVGYTRLVSFGHAAAYGFGAYACGWLLLHTSLPMLAAIPIAGLLAGVIAIGVAWICTQASGVAFSMLTLAFAQLLYAVAYKWTSVTGGSDGLAGIPRRPGPLGLHVFVTRNGFYYLVVIVLGRRLRVLPGAGALAVRRGPRGIRENEAKTVALGYNTRLYKIAVVACRTGSGPSPARSTRLSRVSPIPNCCSGCSRARF